MVASASYRGLSRLLYIIVKEVRPTRVKSGRCEDTGGYGRGSRSELNVGANCQVQPISDAAKGELRSSRLQSEGDQGYF